MISGFELKTLTALYDRARLVPLIGSGMSMPACVSWQELVERLETESGVTEERARANDLIQRAMRAVQILRREGQDVAAALRRALYSSETPEIPAQSLALASIFWPLLCTTNYDDVYLRAKLFFLRSLGSEREITIPRLFGRSETDCRRILQQLNFPDGEVIWAVQGLVAPMDPSLAALVDDEFDQRQFAQELVIGHVEYRKATHRAPHFRRCFAELFRTRSLLFLGSGLTEHYFRSLFDEIIKLTGPPPHPHFALVPEGALDPQFMCQQHHIICETYPKQEHSHVTERLREFANYLKQDRARPSSWGYRIESPQRVHRSHSAAHFTVVRAAPPDPQNLRDDEVVAISCGRECLPEDGRRGRPLLGRAGAKYLV